MSFEKCKLFFVLAITEAKEGLELVQLELYPAGKDGVAVHIAHP